MTKVSFHMKKRIPVIIAALLAGVALAGLMSAVIETPQNEDDFLHDHLSEMTQARQFKWANPGFDLQAQDKTKIGKIISNAERANCQSDTEACDVVMRVNRHLSANHVNADYRVANIKETSQRIHLEITPNDLDMKLRDLSEETRILRFYQTQSGWEQTAADSIEINHPEFRSRDKKFRKAFSQRLTGLNYYPASASWGDFWTEFPVKEIRSDLETARSLNVNAFRIFLTHEYFDNAHTREDALSKLNEFLDLCAEENIKVLVTLFDLRPDYTLSNWAADIDHIDYIFSDISNHTAILGVDLKNQADLDFQTWGAGLVEAWLTVMARHIQTQFANIPVTTGWSRAENAARLHGIFDVVTYHEYQDPESFSARLTAVKSAVGDKPVMITELGSTVWHPPFIKGLGEKAQANRLNSQLSQATTTDGVFVWTLNDFGHVGAEVVGRLPWRQAQQKHYGLTRPDGSFRPAATVLKSFANTPLSNPKQN